jgi:hypothetical protein
MNPTIFETISLDLSFKNNQAIILVEKWWI